jgi:hypothetical protein
MAKEAHPVPPEFDMVRCLALAFPGVEERTSYGTPSFHVGKKFLSRWNEKEGALVLRVELDEREILVEADPDTFFVTDHYRGWPFVLARLSTISEWTLRRLLEQAWRELAPKRAVEAYDQRRAE